MLIFFLTLQPEICEHMAARLPDHKCFVFSSLDTFYTIFTNLINLPDLVILDYTIFNHEIFDVDEYMKSNHLTVPKIYYNDPCLTFPYRPKHWETLLSLSSVYNQKTNKDEYKAVLKIIAEVVEDPVLSPYINLIQKPPKLPKELYVTNMYNETSMKESFFDLISFKEKTKMPDNLFTLLEILYREKKSALSLEQIQQEYEENCRKISLSSLRSQISNLKKILKENSEAKLVIIKRKEGYQLLTYN